MVELPGSTNG